MDSEKLLKILTDRNISISQFCKDIGMSRTTFYKKIRGEREFTRDEIIRIVKYLKLRSPMAIFFNDKVS